jgi:predicted acylesterase/phospholipase RssA
MGGNLKGARSVGAALRRAEQGEMPDGIVGTSVGAIITFGIAAGLRRGATLKQSLERLRDLFLGLTKTSDVATRRSRRSLGLDLLLNRWQGLYDLRPLLEKLQELDRGPETAKAPLAHVVVTSLAAMATVSVAATPEAAIASASEPALVAPGKGYLIDGGVQAILPLSFAIDLGATDITAFLTRPVEGGFAPTDRAAFSLREQLMLSLELQGQALVDREIALTECVNHCVRNHIPWKSTHRLVNLVVDAPTNAYTATYANFGPDDVRRMVDDGYAGR